MQKKLLLTTFIVCSLVTPQPVAATCPTIIENTNITISTNETCSVPAGATYVIDVAESPESTTNIGTLTLTGGSLTISNTAILKTASLIPQGGTIIIQDGGQILLGSNTSTSWVVDTDGDGYTPSFTYYSESATGRIRPQYLNSKTLTDCYDSNANAYPDSSTCSASDRGDGSWDYDCNNVEDSCTNTYNNISSTYTTTYSYITGGDPFYECQGYGRLNYSFSLPKSCGHSGYYCSATQSYYLGCSSGNTWNMWYYTPLCTSYSTMNKTCR